MEKNKVLYTIVGILGISTVGALFMFVNKQDESSTTSTPTSSTNSKINSVTTSDTNVSDSTTTSTAVNKNTSASNTYTDGTYTSSKTTYLAHGHQESIIVKLKIENGKVVSLTNTHSGVDRDSVVYQNSFEKKIESYVIGESIDDISLSRIGGASDTTYAFMEALQEIKTDAQN